MIFYFIFLLHSLNITRESSGTPLNIFYSTSSTVNQLYGANLRVPILQSAELDDNRDGVIDRLEINVKMPVGINETITRFDALFYHTATLSARVKYVFDGVSFVTYETSNPIGDVQIDGDIMLRQTSTLIAKGGYVILLSFPSNLLSFFPSTLILCCSLRQ